MIVRREGPSGAQLSLFDQIEGVRHQVFITDQPTHCLLTAAARAGHRARARVEDSIRWGKDSGFGRFLFRQLNNNAAWLELALTGIDLLAWPVLTTAYARLAALPRPIG